jgi:hypothetical protein
LVVKVKISNLNKYMAICCQNGKGTMIILHSKQWKKSKTNEEFGAWNKCKVWHLISQRTHGPTWPFNPSHIT